MRKSTVAFILLFLTLTSCDYPLSLYYTVTNNSSETVQINYSYTEKHAWKNNIELIDTTLLIPSKQFDTLFTFRSIGPRVYNPDFDNDSIKTIRHFELKRLSDNTIIQTDIAWTKNWKFKSNKNNIATLNYTIN